MNNMTDDDLFQKGQEVHEDPTWDGGWMRGGRPVTNVEMAACMAVGLRERSIKRHEEGCCGEAPLTNGRCIDGGICPRRQAAAWAGSFFDRLKFVADINERKGES